MEPIKNTTDYKIDETSCFNELDNVSEDSTKNYSYYFGYSDKVEIMKNTDKIDYS